MLKPTFFANVRIKARTIEKQKGNKKNKGLVQ
jgi:hypothetical protein